jgi:hypothetical protein
VLESAGTIGHAYGAQAARDLSHPVLRAQREAFPDSRHREAQRPPPVHKKSCPTLMPPEETQRRIVRMSLSLIERGTVTALATS